MTDNLLSKQLDALLFNEHNPVSNLANASALLYSSLKDINWAGFYLYDEQTDSLDLGPFQGKVACMHIKKRHRCLRHCIFTKKSPARRKRPRISGTHRMRLCLKF